MAIAKARRQTQSRIRCLERVIMMNNTQNYSRWVCCPICGGKTRTKVYEDTVLVRFPLYCPKCKKEIRINVVQFKMVMSK